MYWSINLAYT